MKAHPVLGSGGKAKDPIFGLKMGAGSQASDDVFRCKFSFILIRTLSVDLVMMFSFKVLCRN